MVVRRMHCGNNEVKRHVVLAAGTSLPVKERIAVEERIPFTLSLLVEKKTDEYT